MTGSRAMIPVPSSPMGALTRRRPILSLPKKPKRFDDGGTVDVGVAGVDALGNNAIDPDVTGGFDPSINPEQGGGRLSASNPNNTSGLTAAMDALSGERTIGGHLADLALGSRSLSFDPVTGEFAPERDWAATAGKAAMTQMLGPLGPLASLSMMAADKYGTPIDDDRVGRRGTDSGAGMADGGVPPGGIPPQVAALIQAAMQANGGGGGQPGQPIPPHGEAQAQPAPGPPQPYRFMPDAQELVRRYGTAPAPEALATAALAHGGRPGAGGKSGLLRGPGTGRSDDIPADLDPGGFVLRADYVKDQGDGSPEKGAAKIADDLGNPMAAKPIATVRGGGVPAKVSNKEMYLDPADVRRAGGQNALEAAMGPSPKRRKSGKSRR